MLNLFIKKKGKISHYLIFADYLRILVVPSKPVCCYLSMEKATTEKKLKS